MSTPTPGILRQKMVLFILSFLLAMAATRYEPSFPPQLNYAKMFVACLLTLDNANALLKAGSDGGLGYAEGTGEKDSGNDKR